MAVIRTGVLMTPAEDEAAAQAVRDLLRTACPAAIVTTQSSAAGQRNWLESVLMRWCDEEELDLILTIGGTLPAAGPSARETVPEATIAIVERLLPGLSEAMRAYAQERTMLALLDRGVTGIRGRTLVINLPAGAFAAALFLEAIAELIEPVILYLQDRPDAPSLDRELDAASSSVERQGGAQPAASSTAGLDADEFAAFLRRKRDIPTTDK